MLRCVVILLLILSVDVYGVEPYDTYKFISDLELEVVGKKYPSVYRECMLLGEKDRDILKGRMGGRLYNSWLRSDFHEVMKYHRWYVYECMVSKVVQGRI